MRMSKKAEMILKEPLGTLIKGPAGLTMKTFKKMASGKVICVGDIVYEECLKAGIGVEQAIFDGKTLRQKLKNLPAFDISVKNPRSHIQKELLDAIRKGYRRIHVEGEEDLAVLPAVLYASEGSHVLYGQPGEGLVVIDVSKESKKRIKSILDMFEVEK